MSESDDDAPQLSAHAMAALQEFYQEQATAERNLEEALSGNVENFCPQEDWQLSQFWYDEETASRLAREALNVAGATGRCDVVLADPPFLAEECLCKTAITIRYLMKDKVILCTGFVMKDLAERLLGVQPRKFQPKHANGLQNEFRCFTNYDSDLLDQEN
nr:hypothetical protein BaRGS_006467 [Batillaria attramentaria]